MRILDRSTARAFTASAIVIASLSAGLVAGLAMPTQASAAEDSIPKFVLMEMIRESNGLLCQSESFTQCMGFTVERCMELIDESIKACIAPLPDNINPEELQNATLEDCPEKVYSDAGFTKEKSEMCFANAAPK